MARKNLIPRINASVIAGILIVVSLIFVVFLPSLRGANIPIFLGFFLIAAGGYIVAILRLKRDRLSIISIFGFAILFRLTLLFTSPTLSDDVYRYIWDGHLLINGINPYALPVNSSVLNTFDTPLRSLVNHNWMASPYLPTSQLYFALVEIINPQSVIAFQISAVILDLLTGWLIIDMLRQVRLPAQSVIIYLWNPLIIIEFSHGAHVDSLMVCLMMLAFWFLTRESQQNPRNSVGSAIALAASTLTKLIPVLLAPIFWWRWGWMARLIFVALLLVALGSFVPGAGLGIMGPLDGTGVFGALRIYLQQWNYNGGIYHWLEVIISGYPTPGAVPVEIVGQTPIIITKAIMAVLLGLAVIITGWLAWRITNSEPQNHQKHNLIFVQLATLPLGAYLLFTATVHPWYVTIIIPFLPFLFTTDIESVNLNRFIWPWIYFSIAVTLSYLTYLDPENLRETAWVRLLEYIPFYGLLIWAFWKTIRECKKREVSSV